MRVTNKYWVEFIVFISYTLFAMAWVGGTASMSQIMASMGIDSLASASFISGAVTLAKIVGTFAAAWLAIKFGVKKAFFISGLFISIGLLTPFASNYELLLASRFLMGLGGAFMVVYFNPIVMAWFAPNERATINGINAVAFNLGTAIILWQMANFNTISGGWQNTLIILSLASLVLCIVWLQVEDRTAHTEQQEAKDAQAEFSYLDGLKDTFSWSYALTYSGILSFYLCLFTFYPKAGISQSVLVIGAGIVGTLAGIVFSKKYPLRLPVIRWSGLLIVLTVSGLSFAQSEVVQTVCAMLLGFFIFFPVTALISIPHETPNMTGNKITVIFSLFYSISYMVGTLVLWLFGKLVDINQGDYTQAFMLICVVSSSFFIGSFFLAETGKPKELVPCEA